MIHERIQVAGVSQENQPALGSAAGWPLVLYFHHVHPDIEHYTSVTPNEFRLCLDLLLSEFEPLEPGQAHSPVLSRPTCLITFDDGYRDNIEYAAPILAEYGVRAIFFAITGQVGKSSACDPRADFMTLEEYEALGAAGHRVGAHTVTHRRLSTLTEDDAMGEVTSSLQWAERFREDGPPLFAFPYGDLPSAPVVPGGTLGYGTVRCPPEPWTRKPHAIRRTYVPADQTALWAPLIQGWRQQWQG